MCSYFEFKISPPPYQGKKGNDLGGGDKENGPQMAKLFLFFETFPLKATDFP